MKNNASLIYNVCLVVGDFLALVAAFIVAYVLRVKLAVGINGAPLGPTSGRTFLGVFLGVLPFWILIFALLGLYNSNIYEYRFKELGRLLIGSFVGLLFVIFWNFVASKPIFPARLVPVYGFLFGFLFLVIFRNLARFIRVQLFKSGTGLTRVLLVGNTGMTLELLDWLNGNRSGYKVIGVVGGKRSLGEHHAPLYHSFDQFLASHPGEFHGIIQTELYADEARNAKILTYAQENHVGYRFVPGNTELFVGNIEVELFRNSVPVITVHQTALFGWGRVVKRISDLLFGGLALLVASPFMLLITLAIKITEPRSPVLFKPRRTGRYGNTAAIFKFRSMYQKYSNMSPEAGFTKMGRPELIKLYRENGDQLPDDPRVTPVGRIIRKLSLDELPQLMNIVKGDISLVGPRALDPFELDKYAKKNLILAVKTGLTGLAQVSGRRDITFEERRKLDLYYVQNWSLWLDLVILMKTVRVVLGGRGTN
ncbi:MAG TPA: sugar transferase [Candidatus Saccharimonadales bacterium]|nr:sugar transferase [Candidatus Saccharimonadales bacterium]